MGELAEDFAAFNAYKKEERANKEPGRIDYAVQKLMDAGYRVGKCPNDNTQLIVNGYIKLWPYTGWWSGKGVGSGRGIHNLIKKLRRFNDTPNPSGGSDE